MINTREQMRSVIYDGKLTERFNRFLKLADGAGITSVREDANKLMLAINSLR